MTACTTYTLPPEGLESWAAFLITLSELSEPSSVKSFLGNNWS